ncbi:MAG: hypothetical protein HY900_10595 [Deltaproteobacteria bacterium]|nr:hypothetical protein [Deltaproteobacteria bacterium]
MTPKSAFFPAVIARPEGPWRDYARFCAAAKGLTLSLDFDGAVQSALMSSKFWEILGLDQFKWPGGTLRDDEPFQFTGGETLKASEYDEFLRDPSLFTVTKIWPQISTTKRSLRTSGR